jgi:hypothetical protein
MPYKRLGIRNRELTKQIVNFQSLTFINNIRPTNIDALIEYQNKSYVIIEVKRKNSEVPYGQKLAMERLCDDLQKSGKQSICIIATHESINPNDDVFLKDTFVDSVRFNGEWITNFNITTGELLNMLLR